MSSYIQYDKSYNDVSIPDSKFEIKNADDGVDILPSAIGDFGRLSVRVANHSTFYRVMRWRRKHNSSGCIGGPALLTSCTEPSRAKIADRFGAVQCQACHEMKSRYFKNSTSSRLTPSTPSNSTRIGSGLLPDSRVDSRLIFSWPVMSQPMSSHPIPDHDGAITVAHQSVGTPHVRIQCQVSRSSWTCRLSSMLGWCTVVVT